MDVVLVSITGISLVLAVAMGLILFKLQREERLRSEARTALLSEAAGEDLPLSLEGFEHVGLDATRTSQMMTSGDLFAVPDAESPWPRRLAVVLATALIMASAGYGLTFLGTSSSAGENAVAAVPLELIALRHTRDNDSLTIAGTVSNPPGAAPASHIGVTALLFAPDGTPLTSGRTSLDYTTLAPGDESSFEIRIPVRGTVAKYRVGFRRADGSTVAHVDRRNDTPSARSTSRTEGAP